MHSTSINSIQQQVTVANSQLYDLGDNALDIALDDQYVVYLKWLEAGFDFAALSDDEIRTLHNELLHVLARATHAADYI